MKLSIALCASAVTAASLPAIESREDGILLSEFGQVNSVSQDEAEAGIDLGFTLNQRDIQGWPLADFGEVHHVTPTAARQGVDLGGNNFSVLPIFGPGHESSFESWMDKQKDKIQHVGHHFEHRLKHKIGDAIEKVEDIIDDVLQPRDAGDCPNPNIRFEWDNYSASDRQAYVGAIKCLINRPASGKFSFSKNRYEDFVRLHQSYAPNIHSQSTSQQTHKFLLWHRYFVWAFEQVLRDECGFTRAMPVRIFVVLLDSSLGRRLPQSCQKQT